MIKKIRLDKYLSDAEDLARSQAKTLIKKGKVCVDGHVEKRPERKVDPEMDKVTLDGRVLRYEEYVYLMLHKPMGVVSAVQDGKERTVIDCVDARGHSVFPVGRLDKDTEGLLLLTDDGQLAHELLSPRKHVEKSYYALLDQELGQEAVRAVEEGLDIGDEKKTLPGKLVLLGPEAPGRYAVRFVITEGRFHQVKRMAAALGAKVLYLKRESMGELILDPQLKPGEFRNLTKEELSRLSSGRNDFRTVID